ncbi:MAG: PTS sugar transporter subunit IIA [Xanthobacteraceae bacterium]|nr:PTS sugar transporter subunit IIA [Xanthobacteraceae bacterium]
MAELITPDRILPVLNAADKDRAIDKLCRFAAARAGLDGELVRRAVLAREDLTTFGVGRGIAIPHGTVPGMSKPLGALARLKRPVDFGAADGRAADLVFLLLAPESDASILLRALSCVARRLRDREVVKRLRAETGAEAAHVILTSDSWRGHDPHPDRKHAA